MIEINLVPPELRKEKKTEILLSGLNLPLEIVVGIGLGLISLLFITDMTLFFTRLANVKQHRRLQNEWETIAPAKKNVDSVISSLRNSQSKLNSVKAVVENKKIFWSQKFNIISDSLPRDIWLSRISLNGDDFLVEGSVITRKDKGKEKGKEMSQIYNLMSQLKSSKEFLTHLRELELGPIKRTNIKGTDIINFSIMAKVKY